MNPLMPAEDIEAYLTIFERHSPRLVVEWGCGGSTVRFGQHPTIEQWLSIEHDPAWVEKVSTLALAEVVVHHAPVDSDDYVLHPKRLGLKPDLVIVDGRRRNACLRVAREIIAPDGVVLLHDSCRRRYQKGMSLFDRRWVMTPGVSATRHVDREQVRGLYWHHGVTALYVEGATSHRPVPMDSGRNRSWLMNVAVRLPWGETRVFKRVPDSVETVKRCIEDVTTIPAACQELLLDGVPLRTLPQVENLEIDLIVRVGWHYAIASSSLPPAPGTETFHPARSIVQARNFRVFQAVSHRCCFSDNRPLEKTADIAVQTSRANARLEPYRAHADVRRARLKNLCMSLDASALLAMTFNSPYATLFENWHRSCLHHGIDVRFCTVVFPMDPQAESVAKRLGYATFFNPESYGQYEQSAVVSFGSRQWVDCLFMKNAVMGDMLATGVDVLYQDVDMVWRRNPIPYLSAKANVECWDFMFHKGGLNSIFQPLYYNSGFVYARSNEFSRLTWERILDNQRYCYVYRSQQVPVNIIMNTFRERGLRTCALDESLFVNGHRIPVKPKSDSGPLHPGAFMIHFNWNDSLATKLERLRDNGVWYLDDAPTFLPQKEYPTRAGGARRPHRNHECIVSHRFRCIYVSIAKNASSTIKAELRRVDSAAEGLHCAKVAPELWRDYTTFTFLRDPVTRVLSAYQEMSMRLEEQTIEGLPFTKLDEGLERFDAFLERIEAGPWDPHVNRQIDFIGDHRIDFWGRVETIQDDLAYLFDKLGMGPCPPLPRRRSRIGRAEQYGYSKHLLWEKDLPPDMVRRIREIYRDDIALLESVRSTDGQRPSSAVRHSQGAWVKPVVRGVEQ